MRDFHCSLKTQSPPLAPVKRGRGVGGEGADYPEAPRHTLGGRGSRRAPRLLNRRAAQQELRPGMVKRC